MTHFATESSACQDIWPVPAPLVTCQRSLPGDAASAGVARALVRRELLRWGADELIDDCSLIVTELVTNAIRHARSALVLRMSTDGLWIYGEVFDEGDDMPCASNGGLDATGGRGLLIVGGLAEEWGAAAMPEGGKIVWFRMSCPRPGRNRVINLV